MNNTDKVRVYGTGKLSQRSTPATIVAINGRNVTIKFDSGNVTTVDILRIG